MQENKLSNMADNGSALKIQYIDIDGYQIESVNIFLCITFGSKIPKKKYTVEETRLKQAFSTATRVI
jgi:hypothetical protein